ncbi:hypothetical protein WQ54_15200 [Bacillus sp. SA1-12]|uniref:hypothetical protein n=1 Tax=Bacillus sp. SA1-12 TaxID=1455638 RepID=UPI0006267F97|nr:hypothetical protein [Bacillus sp. SA1-12]KKI91368.1 hypothetical protein WQ54_15200 [Bacillus sp. SA1-12]
MKAFKILLSLSLIFPIFLGFSLKSANAETNSNSLVTIMSCPEVGSYTTVYRSRTTSSKTEFTHYASNSSTSTDTVSRSVAITHSATVTLGGKASFDALVSGAEISANVGYGFNNTKTLTKTWSIPQGSWKLTAGSRWVKSTGTRYKVAPPCNLTSPQTTSANYTYATWSAKTQQ